MIDVRFTAHTSPAGAALVVGVWEGGNPTATALAVNGALVVTRALAASPGFTGREGQCITIHAPDGVEASQLLLLGLGPFGGMDVHRARRLGAVVATTLMGSGEEAVVADLELDPATAVAFAQGLMLRARRPASWRTHFPEDERLTLVRAAIRINATPEAEALWPRARAEAEGVLLAAIWARRRATCSRRPPLSNGRRSWKSWV